MRSMITPQHRCCARPSPSTTTRPSRSCWRRLTNIDDPQQQAEFAALAQQESVRLLFYDEKLAHRLTKLVTYSHTTVVPWLLDQAAQLRARIPPEQFDFDQAKRAVLEGMPL
jgi:hypothetical protein